MLEDDTHSSQSTQESFSSNKQEKKGSKKVTRAGNKSKIGKQKTNQKGLTKLDKSLFRTPTNPKGIIKPVNKPRNIKSTATKKKVNTPKQPGKEIVKKLKQLRTSNQDLSIFTKNILQALFEINSKND